VRALDADFPKHGADFPALNRSVRLNRPALDAVREEKPIGVPASLLRGDRCRDFVKAFAAIQPSGTITGESANGSCAHP
jgi:hypothetical protein